METLISSLSRYQIYKYVEILIKIVTYQLNINIVLNFGFYFLFFFFMLTRVGL